MSDDGTPDAVAAEPADKTIDSAQPVESGEEAAVDSDDERQRRKREKKERKERRRARKEEKRLKRQQAAQFVEDEAEEESQDDGDASDDDAEQETADAEVDEQEDATADADEEVAADSESDTHERKKKKKSKKRRMHDRLHEDDFQLLAEAGVNVERRHDIDDDVFGDDEEQAEGGKRQRLRKNRHVGVDEDLHHSVNVRNLIGEEAGPRVADGAPADAEEDDDAFIVDDHDRKIKSSINIDAMDTMYKIFGDMSGIALTQLPMSQADRDKHARALQQRNQRRLAKRAQRGPKEAEEGDDMAFDSEDDMMSEEEQEDEAPLDAAALAKVVDPAFLARRFVTAADERVRTIDVPERLQLRAGVRAVRRVNDADLLEEASFIYIQRFAAHDSSHTPEAMRGAIERVLRYLAVDFKDVPYIQWQCADAWQPLLTPHDLWTIDALDEIWVHIQRRKTHLEQRARDTLPHDTELLLSIRVAQSDIELDDCEASLQVAAPPAQAAASRFRSVVEEEPVAVEGAPKLLAAPRRRTNAMSSDARVLRLAEQMSIKPRSIVQQLESSMARSDSVVVHVSPSELAQQIIDEPLTAEQMATSATNWTVDQLLNAARRQCVTACVNDPAVRNAARSRFNSKAQVNTVPTERGALEIDSSHEFYPVKRIKDKSLSAFAPREIPAHDKGSLPSEFGLLTEEKYAEYHAMHALDTQFALMEKAESEGFVEIRIAAYKHSNEPLDEFQGKVQRSVARSISYSSPYQQQWEDQRRMVANDICAALNTHCVRAARQRLSADARVAICESASRRLELLVSRAPYRPPQLSDEDNEEGSSALRVAACVVGGQSAPTVLSMVNEHGDLIDCLQLHAIQLRVPLSPPDLVASVQQRRAADQSLLNAFLRTHRPRAVVVAASPGSDGTGADCTAMMRELQNSCELERVQAIVELVHSEVGRVFALSSRGRNEFPDRSDSVRQAIGTARFFQCPLSAVCSLWSESTGADGRRLTDVAGNDLLSLRLHPLQSMETPEKLSTSLQRVLYMAVCAVGVDLNEIARASPKAPLLQFVCGLGPRKADALLSRLRASPEWIPNRSSLKTRNWLANCVFDNAIAFLKFGAPPRAVAAASDALAAQSRDDEIAFNDDVALFELTERQNKRLRQETDLRKQPDKWTEADQRKSDAETRKFEVERSKRVEKRSRRDDEMSHAELEALALRPLALDGTRVHPQYYHLAAQIVINALEVESQHVSEDRTMALNSLAAYVAANDLRLVRDVDRMIVGMRRRHRLGELDLLELETFAQQIKADGQGSLLRVLQMIVHELKVPFKDSRFPYKSMSDRDRFFALSGESESSLCVNQLVTVTVDKCTGLMALCRLPSGVRGVLHCRNVSDDRYPDKIDREECLRWMTQRVPQGASIQCRITEIKYLEGEVLLSARKSDVRNGVENAPERVDLDRQYFEKYSTEESAHIEREKQAMRAEAAKYRFIPRSITHPLFKNCSGTEATEYLKTRPVGDFVFRPSTQGSNHLTITWKFGDDSIVHIDVLENNKSTVDSLGQQLVIGNQRFDDLDHIAEAHIGAMNRLLIEWNAHPRFAFGEFLDVSNVLKEKKEQHANVTPYALWVDKSPSLRISFLDNANRAPKSETVQLTPAGYVYRKQTYRSVNLLINAFKAECAKQMAPVAPKPAAPIIPPIQTGYPAQPAYAQPPTFGYNGYAQQPAPMQYYQQQPPVFAYSQPAPPAYPPMPPAMPPSMPPSMPFGVPAPPAPGMHPDRIAQISDDRRGYNCSFAYS